MEKDFKIDVEDQYKVYFSVTVQYESRVSLLFGCSVFRILPVIQGRGCQNGCLRDRVSQPERSSGNPLYVMASSLVNPIKNI
jgi:hypothetical protein